MADLKIAKVLALHDKARAADIQYIDGGGKVPMVQVMGDVSSVSGRMDFHHPDPPPDTKNPLKKTGRDLYAVVGTASGMPVILGFLAPQVSEVLFDRKNFRVDRHPSDVYSTLDDEGALTVAWPNGTYLKVGEDNALEDLSGKDFDEKWAITRNKARAPDVRLMVKNGSGVQKALLDIDGATGRVTLTTAENLILNVTGDLTAAVTGNMSATVGGNASFAVTGSITSSANGWSHTGDLNLTGTITASVDVIGGGKHLKTHVHTDPQGGSTGPPS